MGVAAEPIRLDRMLAHDPWAVYEQLRSPGPVCPVIVPGDLPGWLVTRHADARLLLDDRRLSKDRRRAAHLYPDPDNGLHALPLSDNMLNFDPPDHTRLRTLVSKAFTARTVARLRPAIQRIADDLLVTMAADVAEHGSVDLLDALAFPLPIAVISELLGVPHDDRERLRGWSKAFTSGVPLAELNRTAHEVSTYLADLVIAKRAQPTDDLLSDLVQVSDEGDRLSETELAAMALLLVVAGHETTVNLIGNSVLALLRHPDQLAALRADPALLPGAVEEFLRYEGPIHIATTRFTTEPVQVGDVTIPADEFVFISLLEANRDAERFPDADRLDITRAAGGHLAFGHGIHYCLGAPLARLEAEITLGALLRTFDTLSLAGEPTELEWRGSSLIHGLRRLPIHASPATD
jgi:cytochrome P450